MALTDILGLLPLLAGVLWFGVAGIPLIRYRSTSPYQQSLTTALLLLGAWGVVAGCVRLFPPEDPVGAAMSYALASLMTVTLFTFFIGAKWLYFGHARWDALFALPVLFSLVLIAGGAASGMQAVPVAPNHLPNPTLYVAWAGIQVAYLAPTIGILSALYAARHGLIPRYRRQLFLSAVSLYAFLTLWLALDVYANVMQTLGFPWAPSLLLVPPIVALVTLAPLSPEELGEAFRGLSGSEQRVNALYVFYKNGEPLVAMGSNRNLPIEADQLQGILDVIGNFVETSMREYPGYSTTTLRFDRLEVVAVRGEYVVVAAIYDGHAYDVLQGELLRSVRAFEARWWKDLATWEGAAKVAEEVAEDLSRLMSRAPPAFHPSNGRADGNRATPAPGTRAEDGR